jgi:methionyl-tRNA formyltransferase
MPGITTPKLIFAGERALSVKILRFIHAQNVRLSALMVCTNRPGSSAKELIAECPYLKAEDILIGPAFRSPEGLDHLRKQSADYIIGVHFPYLIPKEVLNIPSCGVLNLHPALLPYNRGWHTPTWAIYDRTPYGATLHFMDEGVDTGDIVAQSSIVVNPEDTADSLYKRVLDREYDLFTETWPLILTKQYQRRAQSPEAGTFHKKPDIQQIQGIDLEQEIKAGKLIDQLRALTTNDPAEGAYFMRDGERYTVQIKIIKEKK